MSMNVRPLQKTEAEERFRSPASSFQHFDLLAAEPYLAKAGGADRDRTDDLKLAKLALSQLSYGP